MSGFSPEWLALREPVDQRSRCALLAADLARHFAGRREVRIVDLGCGTGSNLRGTSHLLPREQRWMLVDYDERLLARAREELRRWAEACVDIDGGLGLERDGRHLHVTFLQANLNDGLDRVLVPAPDLVTASAFFDLCSAAFIDRFVSAVAGSRAAFYTVLTYDGAQEWSPAHEADADMLAAFRAHQLTDKGFGAAAGWTAPAALAAAFRARRYEVAEGSSPWRLAAPDRQLIAELARGFADAAAETGAVSGPRAAAWRAVARTGAVVGHIDTLALPAPG